MNLKKKSIYNFSYLAYKTCELKAQGIKILEVLKFQFRFQIKSSYVNKFLIYVN